MTLASNFLCSARPLNLDTVTSGHAVLLTGEIEGMLHGIACAASWSKFALIAFTLLRGTVSWLPKSK